ncbi:ATP-dependent RNA helicase DEAH12, chloroplastic [Aplysia californica]|uniref:ATP-dependent RNA helicase DEAH12, chloroplastic n=1 Tax=Aplysia californica TaxID=6500 RepID=A0ABM0JTF7_APLCA|nr:ATP-dependent RNA helicase DEAH12, chloroplastic [Aplysia californica]
MRGRYSRDGGGGSFDEIGHSGERGRGGSRSRGRGGGRGSFDHTASQEEPEKDSPHTRGRPRKKTGTKYIIHHHYSPAHSSPEAGPSSAPLQSTASAEPVPSATGPQYQISLSIGTGAQPQQPVPQYAAPHQAAPHYAAHQSAPPLYTQPSPNPAVPQYASPHPAPQYAAPQPPPPPQYAAPHPPPPPQYAAPHPAPQYAAPQPPPPPQHAPSGPQYASSSIPQTSSHHHSQYPPPLLDLPPPYEPVSSQRSQAPRYGPRENRGANDYETYPQYNTDRTRGRHDSTSSMSSSASGTMESRHRGFKENAAKSRGDKSTKNRMGSKEGGQVHYGSVSNLSDSSTGRKGFYKEPTGKFGAKYKKDGTDSSSAEGYHKMSSSLTDLSTGKPRPQRPDWKNRNKEEVTVKSKKVDSTDFYKTKAVVQIKDFFPDTQSVKNVVTHNFFQREDVKVEFVEDAILTTRERAVCTIILKHKKRQLGTVLITEMCKRIKKNLKTEVTWNTSTTSDSCVGTNKKKNKGEVGKGQSNVAQNQDKEEKECSEGKKKGKSNKTNKEQPADVESSVPVDGEPAEGSSATKGVPAPVSTTLQVCVGRDFKNNESVLAYFQQNIKVENCPIEVVPGSIDICPGETHCKLQVPSKAAAKRLRSILNKHEEVKIGDDEKPEEKYENDMQRNRMERHIQDASSMISSSLSYHKEKTQKLEESLATLKQKTSKHLTDRDSDEILAVMDKLTEVTRQKKIFQERCTKLMDQLKDFSPSKKSSEDCKNLLQSISIECKRLSDALPMYARRNDIQHVISSNQISIIIGETGSGKSTQMAQYIYESDIAVEGMIVCTQPRKIAARTLAERVAVEMSSKVGRLVDHKTSALKALKPMTKIVFMTDHSLLNEFLKDKNLSSYSCIIIDEAHERSIYTDILLGMVKSCVKRRPELKLVITSATIDPDIFMNYFPIKPALLHVSGRTFPVDVIYDKTDGSQDFENIEEKAMSKVVDIHNRGAPGDILVFLTSAVEIMHCCEEIKRRLKDQDNYECFPLHGQLPPAEQQKVFKRLEEGVRKIVFATNCAETSVTIDGIKFVVDTGVAKEMRYDSKKNISLLGTHVISQSSANQRKGRAGRTSSGTCYRLFSKDSFLAMAPSSDPEILRVHLGQAMLKLAELGVNGRHYDFVQSPSEEALDTAVNTLVEIGALLDGDITETGRFISKLPFDPRQGLIVYFGLKDELLYDAVVIAALLSNDSDLFYKGLTDMDEQRSARNKNQFASPYGDPFTWFNVFQEWSSLANKEQSAWCAKHSVNYKIMNFTRQCVKDVAGILQKELEIEMSERFSTDETAIDRLRKMIFKANLSMVGHYLGHHRAGYFASGIHRQVHFHPSSSLVCQNAHPEWIVYSQFIKTSRDFIKGITVIDEHWVQEAIQKKDLAFDIEEVKGKQIHRVHHEEAGTAVFRSIVGPRYRNIVDLEDCLANSGMGTVVVEADRDLGTVDIFSASPSSDEITKALDGYKQRTVEGLQSREREFSLSKTSNKERSGCRVTLGQGASVKAVLMPGQSNTVLIKKASDAITVEEMKTKFSAYGDIKDCFRFKSEDPWGMIKYATCSEAENAVNGTRNDQNNIAVLKVDQTGKEKTGQFQARLSWLRRPVKGKGTAFIKCSPLLQPFLVGQSILLDGKFCDIKMPEKGDDLICFNARGSSEDHIKEEVVALLKDKGQDEKSLRKDIFISMVREKRDCLTPGEKKEMETRICNRFSECLPSSQDTCTVELKPPKNTDIRQIGFVYFNNPVSGFRACQYLQGSLTSDDGQPIDICPKLRTSIHIPRSIMKANEERFNDIIEGLKTQKATEVTKVSLKQGDYRLDICSNEAQCIVDAREIFQSALEGEVIECRRSTLLECLLKRQGLDAVRSVEKSDNVLIIVNQRDGKLHIHGVEKDVAKAKLSIDKYLSRLVDGREECISLRGVKRPPGLMKALLLKYGDTLGELQNEFGLNNIKVDFRQQKISVVGQDEALENCIATIEEMATSLSQGFSDVSKFEMPECVACLCQVDTSAELYRLEGCGHCYCLVCIRQQVIVSVQDKQFPLSCVKEDCNRQLVWKDFEFFLHKKWIQEEKLVQMSLNAYVEQEPDKYKFCPTPNCPVIYEVTLNPDGCVFTCPSCFSSFCSSCGKASHPGLTCEMSQSWSLAERELERWLQEDPSKRKQCPECKTPIEKIEGCNKMHCSACHIVFCWLCLQTFTDEQPCYAHLVKTHGGFC